MVFFTGSTCVSESRVGRVRARHVVRDAVSERENKNEAGDEATGCEGLGFGSEGLDTEKLFAEIEAEKARVEKETPPWARRLTRDRSSSG